jgi:hypothetical protein
MIPNPLTRILPLHGDDAECQIEWQRIGGTIEFVIYHKGEDVTGEIEAGNRWAVQRELEEWG